VGTVTKRYSGLEALAQEQTQERKQVIDKETDLLKEAILFLAGQCDHARSRDGSGFNKFDQEFGHQLAKYFTEGKELSQTLRSQAIKMVRKYAKQLFVAGIDIGDVEAEVKKAKDDDKPEMIPTAILPDLVDIVEQNGTPAFLLLKDGELVVETAIPDEGNVAFVPPDRQAMPWLLPRADEVMRWYADDSDQVLFNDLVQYHEGISALPHKSHYKLLAAYDMLTYLQEHVRYLPIIVFEGFAERGKSRTGEGMTYVSYRGIHENTVRDTHLVRYCAEFNATLFIDTMDLWRKVEKQSSEDIMLGRFEKGASVRRVLWPERGLYRDSQYYPIFGPTIIATNRSLDSILETRCLSITPQEADADFQKKMSDVLPETSLLLRERLVAFRARHMNDSLLDVPKPCIGRLGNITKPIVQVVHMVSPQDEKEMLELVALFRKQRLAAKAESWAARVFTAFLNCWDKMENGVVPIGAVAENFNIGLPEDQRVTGRRISPTLGHLGLQKAEVHGGRPGYLWPSDEVITRIKLSLGLEAEPENVTGAGERGERGEHCDVRHGGNSSSFQDEEGNEENENEKLLRRASEHSPCSPCSPNDGKSAVETGVGERGERGEHCDVRQGQNSFAFQDVEDDDLNLMEGVI